MKQNGHTAETDALRRVVEEALPMAREQAHLIGELRSALESGDERAALAIARRLCGLSAFKVAS